MGRKGKAEQHDLVELIVSKSDGGKNTIVYVTEEVNSFLELNGLKVRFSREAIRRVLKSHDESIQDAKRASEAARAMADVLKDYPATEASEAMLMKLSSLIAQDMRHIDSLEFDNPVELCNSAARIAESQLKMSQYRTKAVSALEKAKSSLKVELKSAIVNDQELLLRLYAIIDKVEVK